MHCVSSNRPSFWLSVILTLVQLSLHYCRAATSSAAIIKWNSKPGTSSPGQTPIDGQEWLLWTPNSLPGHQPDVDLEWALTCFSVKLTFLCLQDTLHPEHQKSQNKRVPSIWLNRGKSLFSNMSLTSDHFIFMKRTSPEILQNLSICVWTTKYCNMSFWGLYGNSTSFFLYTRFGQIWEVIVM